ncbi:NRROS regulator, partial [Amia calva]|nr:NRROS regulator [Amia calva]
HSVFDQIQRTAMYSDCLLMTVPSNLPQNIDELQLNKNYIKVLENSSLAQYPQLRTLSCADNGLKSIEHGVFSNTPCLENLNLAKNSLETGYHQTGLALRLLPRLRVLDLSGNELNEDMASFILQNLTSLEVLSLSRNLLMRLDRSIFSSLHQLVELNLERNLLFEIEEHAFHSLQKLQRLSLAFNNLPCLMDFHLTQLVVLNASHNAIEWFIATQDMEEVFYLETLDLSDNKLLFFPLLPNRSHIRNLLLSNNQLSFYEHLAENNSEDWPTTIQFYNLNNITNVTTANLWDETLYSNTSYLDLLDMSQNQIHYLPRGFLSKMPSLSRLRLGRNCLKSLDITSEEFPASLIELDLSNNLLTKLRTNQSLLHVLPNLTHLNLSSNYLQTIPPRLFVGMQSLATVDLSYNKVGICSTEDRSADANYSDCAMWGNISSLRHLHLLNCNLQKVPPWAFEGTPITHLELTNNPGIHIEQNMLQSLSRTLQHLSLGNTAISHLEFTPCTHLKSLDISRNSLTHLPDSILSLSLKLLDLRDNNLTTILPDQAKVLGHSIQTLFLGGNPFNCCELDWLDIFQEKVTMNIEDRTEATCLLSNTGRREWLFGSHMCIDKNGEEPSWTYILLFLPVCLSLLGICIVFYLSFRPRLLPMVIKKRYWRATTFEH